MIAQVVEPKWRRDVGRVAVRMNLENFADVVRVADGTLSVKEVASIEVEALVDTGARYIGLPTSLIEKLGLHFNKIKTVRTAAGLVEVRMFSPVRFTVQERDGISEVAEIPEGSPALLGQLPLEQLDFWIDMTNQKLVGNPEHGGKWMFDMF